MLFPASPPKKNCVQCKMVDYLVHIYTDLQMAAGTHRRQL